MIIGSSIHCDFQHFFHFFNVTDLKTFPDFFRNLCYIRFILGRNAYGTDTCSLCCQQFFFQTADWQHATTQCDLTGHCHIRTHRFLCNSRQHCRRHGNTGRWTILRHSPLRNMDMDIVFCKKVFRNIIRRTDRTDITDACLCRLFHHVSQLTCCVEASTPLPELGGGTIGEVEEAIGRNVASLVEDGSTLQLGIGTIPDAVLKFLGDKKDLGIHSEMFSDGVVDLYQKGVITGANKRLDKGKMVAAFLMGSKKLYDFVDDNPDVMMRTVDYVNNPAVICQNPKVVSINSCLQVDFNGQVNSESMGTKQFSGIGGQLDYVRGAAMCPDGKAILAMPSTAKHGEVSRIVPVFEPGTTVTTTRTDVHYIVTEYGVANLRAKSLRERARLLINIAHPKFRDQLWEAYYERYGKEDQ